MKRRMQIFKESYIAGLSLAIVAALTMSIAAEAAAGGLDPSVGSNRKVLTYTAGATAPVSTTFISQAANDGWVLDPLQPVMRAARKIAAPPPSMWVMIRT